MLVNRMLASLGGIYLKENKLEQAQSTLTGAVRMFERQGVTDTKYCKNAQGWLKEASDKLAEQNKSH
jgi:hypothetical protein